jgi:hypothetical protein
MTPKEVRQWAITHYDYNPVTGIFTNRISGVEVRRKHPKGYVVIEIRGRKFFAHRVAYLIMEGEWPEQIDHRNRVRDDNRWENLLNADQFLNAQNHSLRVTNKTGVSGVCFMKGKGWVAEMTRNGRRRRVISLPSFEEAVEARREMEDSFARGEWGQLHTTQR